MNLLFDVFKIIPADIYKIIRSVIKIPYVSVAVILNHLNLQLLTLLQEQVKAIRNVVENQK